MNLMTKLHKQFILPAIRETDPAILESICLALIDAGFTILEITLMHESAFSVIKKLSARQNVLIAAGTVLTVDNGEKAIDCGAQFLVSPGLNENIFSMAKTKKIPYFPGVLTPTEIMQANQLGAELIKIFPIASMGGVNYIKSLQGPFPELKIMASGGISLPDIKKYQQVGARCVTIGSQLMPVEKIKARDWKSITQNALFYRNEIQVM